MPAFIDQLNAVQDSNIYSVNAVTAASIATVNEIVLEVVPSADLMIQISLADGSWQEPPRPSGWIHFHRDETRKGLVDSNDQEIPWSISRDDVCQGGADGENPGLYPTICEDQMNTSSVGSRVYRVTGFDPNKYYSFEFWSGFESAQRPWESNTGKTRFAIQGYTPVSIQHKGYTGHPVVIENVYPESDTVAITVEAIDSATYFYFNVMVIRQFTPCWRPVLKENE